ncbi:MAG: hypothetical protein C0448_14605 [Sphingobacteriaceae bacterium]|nr:hypothetical protein [Sphingobacteriaceae bacterium]
MKTIKAGFKELGDTLQITVTDKPILFIKKIQSELKVNQFLVSTPDFESFDSKSIIEIADDKYQMLRLICKPEKFTEYISFDIFDEFVPNGEFLKHSNNLVNIDYDIFVASLEKEVNKFISDKLN